MGLLKRRASREAEIPTSSLADIAFLLLIFFLVTTTIDVDTGIYMELPPPLDEETPPPEIPDRNILTVLVNASGNVLLEGEFTEIPQIRPAVKRFINNRGADPTLSDSPDKGIVSFKTERQSKYEQYVKVLDEIKMGFNELRAEEARRLGFRDYEDYQTRLPQGEEDAVAQTYPFRISIAEPDATNPSATGSGS
ncbi:MAG: biopolymer transporter ExbD [Bacteroidota bacterium]